NGRATLTIRGPENKTATLNCPPEGEWLCVRLKISTVIPQPRARELFKRKGGTFPGATDQSFLVKGPSWGYPDFENAETFVKHLVHDGLIAMDLPVNASLQDAQQELSIRSTRRHFLQATGMTQTTIRQIERARHATNLLKQGLSILDTVYEAGYFDQAHLTRSLSYFIGQTPTQIIRAASQLSF